MIRAGRSSSRVGRHRVCPTGCGRLVPSGRLVCPGCWRRIPEPLRRTVFLSWRVVRRCPGDQDAVAAWRAAAEAAIAAATAARAGTT